MSFSFSCRVSGIGIRLMVASGSDIFPAPGASPKGGALGTGKSFSLTTDVVDLEIVSCVLKESALANSGELAEVGRPPDRQRTEYMSERHPAKHDAVPT